VTPPGVESRPLCLRDALAIEAASHLGWVDGIEQLAVHVAAENGVGPDDAFFLGVALREALVNAMLHGHGFDARRAVRVEIQVDSGKAIIVTIRDQGPGFDPASVPDPRTPENVRRSHGRGVFLMRQFADVVAFSFPPDGGTVVRLEKRLPRAA